MVVCKFFQQGYCRFGKNCRYEHIYGSKYSYHANPAAPAPTPAPQQQSGVTDEQLVNQVQLDIQAALRGGQWILSCYSPYKDKPHSFPGIIDLSPEEARLFIYEAKNNNTVDQAVAYMNNLFKEARQKYQLLLQPNITIIEVLRSLYRGESAPSPFSNISQTNVAQNTFSNNNTASSIFRSAVQTAPVVNQNTNNAQTIFSQGQNSIFNTQPPDAAKELFSKATNVFGPSVPPANIFAQQNPDNTAKSIFAQQNQDVAKSIFAQQNQETAAKSIFATAVQNNYNANNQSNAPNIFATGNQNVSPFSQGNVFQTNQNQASVFGIPSNKPKIENDPGVFSKMEDLTEGELEAFKSDSFQLGFIPEMPPPYELSIATNTSYFH